MGDNRGGPRTAPIGARLPNRSDLRITPSNLPASGEYGQGAAQARALAAVPTAGGGATAPVTGGQPGGGPGLAALAPGDIPSLEDPTANPDEPVTAGLPIGPGAGPEALGLVSQDSPELSIARNLYLQFPSSDLRRYIAFLEETLQF